MSHEEDRVSVYGAYVPVLPERAREEWSISRDVPKSDNIARGLGGRIFSFKIASHNL